MDMHRFTQKSQEALQTAQSLAIRHSHQQVDGGHLLAALLESDDDLVPSLLRRMGIEPALVRRRLEDEIVRRPQVSDRKSVV